MSVLAFNQENDLCLALAPLEVVDLVNLEVLRVIGEQTRLRSFLIGKADLSVDVEWEVGAASRPDLYVRQIRQRIYR